jgi:hypothetical protein
MSPLADVRGSSAPVGPGRAPGLVRLLCTSNPFYVLSAGAFLAGLWASFGAQSREVNTWALMAGLAGYTLLLALAGCVLVRFAGAWDDVRTVLLLVVLMFLATSVTFDEPLRSDPDRGLPCFLGGLLFAVALSEGVLRAIRLALPPLFRVPYYLILSLFFLYPLTLAALPGGPDSEALKWGLFGFSPAAGLVFLTLLPAVRRGPAYIRDNGSPWRWPLYPWALFGLLGLAVPARALMLCWSMHVPEDGTLDEIVFGPYFLVPFGLAGTVLLLEAGLTTGRRAVLAAALAAPVGLAALTLVGHRPGPLYQGFLESFADELGAGPLCLTLLASAAFYAYAALRRAPFAAEALTAALLVLTVCPSGLDLGEVAAPRPLPLLAAAGLQLRLGLLRGNSWRCLFGAGGLVWAAVLALPEETVAVRGLIAFHLAVLALLVLGAELEGRAGRALRAAGGALVLLACLAATFSPWEGGEVVPPWAAGTYPLVLIAALAGYGLALRHRLSLGLAGLALVGCLGEAAWRGYGLLRQVVSGLDQMVLGLALLVLAVLISLGKAGALSRWGGALNLAVGRFGWAGGEEVAGGPAQGPGAALSQAARVEDASEEEDLRITGPPTSLPE